MMYGNFKPQLHIMIYRIAGFMYEVQTFANFANQSSVHKCFDHNSYVFV